MSKEVIQALKSGLYELEKSKADIDKQIKALRITLEYLQSRISTNASYRKDVANTAFDVLMEQRPRHRKEIYEAVMMRGVEVAGQDPVNNLGAHMSGDARFKSLGGGIWDLDETYLEKVGTPSPPTNNSQ